ncbi:MULTISPECIES: glycosyltransferase [unclassified Kaistella]|uniref:glycosyltransferase n=1 Tax=unclassified Kaistella TaxID=2762626 RepID=UPI0027365E6E|nr:MULTISPECIES: glycosyltransferase [unclassified Kaistella]MDP2454946.1 glycosyltransferase [Kaistella sp. SH11-4b]MDP2456071.1 glycosyltransferase [Kaistella sp. SH40-3]MDP2460616.1 glycosyltransferase [Kaistella sp. SH19-2b]
MKKKILIRIGSLRHGGAEKVLVTFLKNLPEDKCEIDLLLNLYSGKYLPEVPNWINVLYLNKGEMITTNRLQDIPVKAFRVIYQKMLKMFPSLLYQFILKGKKYDIEFAAIHGFRDEILNSPLKSSKKLIWIHNDLKKTELYHYTDDEIRKFFGFDKIMVISEKIQQDFEILARTEKEKNKIVRIYNPLDTEEILKKSELENQTSKPETQNPQPTFVSVGTVFPQKGFDRLLRVHKRLFEEGFKHRIQILGDGYDFENIKKLQKDLGVSETSTLFGFTDNPYPFIKNADIYILSSRYEGFPTVLFEAITLKKKIIATDVSGVREMLADGKLGLIVENSEDGIYEGMKKALKNPDRFQQYEEHLKDYEMPFNLENSVNSIIKILDEL